MTIGPEIDPKRARALPFVVAWAVMLLLAGLSLWTAFLGMGIWARRGADCDIICSFHAPERTTLIEMDVCRQRLFLAFISVRAEHD
jgi:hypothetical protein